MYPQKKTLQLWKLWTWEVSTCRSRARSESELSLQQVQTPALPSTGGSPREVEGHWSSPWGRGHWQPIPQVSVCYYFLCFHLCCCSVYFLFLFSLFLSCCIYYHKFLLRHWGFLKITLFYFFYIFLLILLFWLSAVLCFLSFVSFFKKFLVLFCCFSIYMIFYMYFYFNFAFLTFPPFLFVLFSLLYSSISALLCFCFLF